MLNTPVLFIVFNRPVLTKQVFEAIRKAQPKQLFVAADGPRPDKQGEKEKCEAVRKIVTDVDWDCEVKTLFHNENLGCGVAPSQGISWFFKQVECGIILEDDCMPHQSFFKFCTILLEVYKNEEQVMHIGGTNSQFGKKRGKASYYFSKYPHIWGWASWRRAWQNFRFSFKEVDDKLINNTLIKYDFSSVEKKYWLEHWKLIKEGGRKDIWDIQWTFTCWLNNGVTIVPNVNLISNIGFNEDATHTTSKDSKLGNLQVFDIGFLRHPKLININKEADKHTFNNYNLLVSSQKVRIKQYLRNIIPNPIRTKIKKVFFNDK